MRNDFFWHDICMSKKNASFCQNLEQIEKKILFLQAKMTNLIYSSNKISLP